MIERFTKIEPFWIRNAPRLRDSAFIVLIIRTKAGFQRRGAGTQRGRHVSSSSATQALWVQRREARLSGRKQRPKGMATLSYKTTTQHLIRDDVLVAPYQTPKGAKPVAEYSCHAGSSGVEREGAFSAMNANRYAEEIPFVDAVASFQGGIANEKQRLGLSVSVDQSMKNQSVVDFVEKDGSALDVGRMQWMDSHRFSIVDCGGHAITARFKMNWRSLMQQRGQDVLRVESGSFVGLCSRKHVQKSHMKKV